MRKILLIVFLLAGCMFHTMCYQTQPPANPCSQVTQPCKCNCKFHSKALENMVLTKLAG